MQNNFRPWMLPEGVVESLPQEAKKINRLIQTALDTFSHWGYQPLRPPIMEYAETFISGEGSNDLVEQTIQFKDQKSGKQLGFRADITPQIARIDAHYLTTKNIARYAYAGEVVRSYPTGHHSLRNPTVVGAELLGSASQQADEEIVNLLINFLKQLDLPQITIELGNIDIVVELLKTVGLESAQFRHFFEALCRKDTERLVQLCKRNQIDALHQQQLLAITRLYGDEAILEEALVLFANMPNVLPEITRLQAIAKSLAEQHENIIYHIDLSDIHGYSYHNGLIFSAYVEGVWKAIARGGRYDSFGQHFSSNNQLRPSMGFSCELNLLLPLLKNTPVQGRFIEYSPNILGNTKALAHFVQRLRENGDTVIACFDDNILPNTTCSHRIDKTDLDYEVVRK